MTTIHDIVYICQGTILGTGRVFLDRAGPASLAFPTEPDRPVRSGFPVPVPSIQGTTWIYFTVILN